MKKVILVVFTVTLAYIPCSAKPYNIQIIDNTTLGQMQVQIQSLQKQLTQMEGTQKLIQKQLNLTNKRLSRLLKTAKEKTTKQKKGSGGTLSFFLDGLFGIIVGLVFLALSTALSSIK